MGNSESSSFSSSSSSQSPRGREEDRSNKEEDSSSSSSESPRGSEEDRSNKEEEEKEVSSLSTMMKVGAAMAGTALLAFGAWEEDCSNKEEEEKEVSSLSTMMKVGAAMAGMALLAFGAWNLNKSRSSDESDCQQTAQGNRGGGFGYAPSGNYNHYLKGSQNLNSGIIKFMSYNVSSNEENLQVRLAAIGRLVQQHEPDVIFFQEITPNIYDIFYKSNWWEAYKCSVSPEEVTKDYFCMLLTKLPAKKFYCQPLSNSTTGKELWAAEIDVGMGQNLIVATSHLKSPTPTKTYSMQRVEQAKKALNFVRNAPNVIFGGDMNWDEDSDGPFPLEEGWVDAWSQLRPGDDGWTYDTGSNHMLNLNRPLQKRLDRFICKLNNFRLVEIDMIGTDKIPGLLYKKKWEDAAGFAKRPLRLAVIYKTSTAVFAGDAQLLR